MAVGAQKGFSWHSLALAGVGPAMDKFVDNQFCGFFQESLGVTDAVTGQSIGGYGHLAQSMLSNTLSGIAAAPFAKGGFDMGQVLTDAMGQSVGQSWGQSLKSWMATPQQNYRAQLNAANRAADPGYYRAQALGLSGNALSLQAIDTIRQSAGLGDDQFDRLSSLREQLTAGAVAGPEIVSRPDLAYVDGDGNAMPANARFNRASGQIEVYSALVLAANTAGGAAHLLAALNEEHAEWALHAADASLGRNVDGGAVMGFGSMLVQIGQMERQGVANLDSFATIDGIGSSFSANVTSLVDAFSIRSGFRINLVM